MVRLMHEVTHQLNTASKEIVWFRNQGLTPTFAFRILFKYV